MHGVRIERKARMICSLLGHDALKGGLRRYGGSLLLQHANLLPALLSALFGALTIAVVKNF